jgi:hypothetical protein
MTWETWMTSLNRALMLLVVSVALASGCKSKPAPEKPRENPPSPLFNDVDQRLSESQQRGEELSQIAARMPGRNAEEDRKLIAGAFDRAHAALELLAGPDAPGALRQSIRIVDNARQSLAGATAQMSIDPTVDSGLRAIYSGLENVRERAFPNDPQVKSLVNDLHTRVEELDTVRGPLHSIVVANAFRSASDVIRRMAGEMGNRTAAPVGGPATP